MSEPGTLAERLLAVRRRIAEAERASSREPGSVKLVCVSKTHPASAIREAYALGERRFGESYAKELVEKAELLTDLPDIEWHFIGHLQSNKAKLVAKVAHVVHSVDSPPLLRELVKRYVAAGRAIAPASAEAPSTPEAPTPAPQREPDAPAAPSAPPSSARPPPSPTRLRVLLEVNIGGEAQKHGVTPSELPELVAEARAEPVVELVGLMTMPPAHDDAEAKRVFSTLRTLRNLVGQDLPELSMGMSDDLEAAVAEGATYVRIGTAIFGARE